jgi:hypothetical protein
VPLPKRPRLRLPLVLTSVVLGSAAAIAACTPDEPERYFCIDESPYFPDAALAVDAGPAPDALECGPVVDDPAKCPPGCTPEPLG